MLCDVAGYFAAAGRVPDVDRIAQIKVRRELRDVGGVRVHFVAGRRLSRTTVTASIVGNDTVAVRQEVHHLGIPVIGRQRPAVVEDDWLSTAPVLVIDLNPVLGRDRIHEAIS